MVVVRQQRRSTGRRPMMATTTRCSSPGATATALLFLLSTLLPLHLIPAQELLERNDIKSLLVILGHLNNCGKEHNEPCETLAETLGLPEELGKNSNESGDKGERRLRGVGDGTSSSSSDDRGWGLEVGTASGWDDEEESEEWGEEDASSSSAGVVLPSHSIGIQAVDEDDVSSPPSRQYRRQLNWIVNLISASSSKPYTARIRPHPARPSGVSSAKVPSDASSAAGVVSSGGGGGGSDGTGSSASASGGSSGNGGGSGGSSGGNGSGGGGGSYNSGSSSGGSGGNGSGGGSGSGSGGSGSGGGGSYNSGSSSGGGSGSGGGGGSGSGSGGSNGGGGGGGYDGGSDHFAGAQSFEQNMKQHPGMMVVGMVGVAFAVGAAIAAIAVGQGRRAVRTHKLDGILQRRIKSFSKFASNTKSKINLHRPDRVCQVDHTLPSACIVTSDAAAGNANYVAA